LRDVGALAQSLNDDYQRLVRLQKVSPGLSCRATRISLLVARLHQEHWQDFAFTRPNQRDAACCGAV
jgi:hypothetical protein